MFQPDLMFSLYTYVFMASASTHLPNGPEIEAPSLALTHAMHMRFVHFVEARGVIGLFRHVFFSPLLLLESSSTIISGYFKVRYTLW